MSNNKCPFCVPEVNVACFAESDNFRALYNIAPVLPGHCMIVPKKHLRGFLETKDEHMFEMILFSKRIIRLLMDEFHAEGFDFTIQDGKSAGQSVEHMHAHIVPRKTNDMPEPGNWYPALEKSQSEFLDSNQREKYNSTQLKTIVDHLSEKYNSLFPEL